MFQINQLLILSSRLLIQDAMYIFDRYKFIKINDNMFGISAFYVNHIL